MAKALKTPGIRCKPGEEWAEVTDNYCISNYGRWYSRKRKALVKQFPNSSGYFRIKIWDQEHANGKQTFTHIKVLYHFGDCHGNRIPGDGSSLFALGLSIDHINGDKSDNRRCNLELVTHKENCIRRSKNMKEKKEKSKCHKTKNQIQT
ncbi:MAG: HNH endonuclease, partial [Ignavibacteria bacterium]|nr:HNH endonuclease [Ignavibacteria bacterium]